MIKKLTNYLFKSIKILKLGDVLGPSDVDTARQFHRHTVLDFAVGRVRVLDKFFPHLVHILGRYFIKVR